MDYHSIHGHDIASFNTPSTHRLPTVSASAALDEIDSGSLAHVSTGLEELDKALVSVESHDAATMGGIKRGQVTELWGPPGSGKTAVGIQLAANAFCDGNCVVWIDCFQTVAVERMKLVTDAVAKSRGGNYDRSSQNEGTCNFIRYDCLTLPHLMALVARPTTKSIPKAVTLVIISSITALINSALPKSQENNASSKQSKGPHPSAKRRQALQSVMKALQTLALTRNCAVVLLSQCATKIQSERGASLAPAVNATVWAQGISTQIVLFRDWGTQKDESVNIFFAGVQKLDGKATEDAVDRVSAFKIDSIGIASVPCNNGHLLSVNVANMTQPKRKLGNTDFEVPDSEDDEDYGWADEDEAFMPAPPPQWQGSEDILLGHEVGRSDDECDGEDEHEDEC